MKRIQKKKSPILPIIITLLAIVLLGGGAYAYYQSQNSSDNTDSTPSNQEPAAEREPNEEVEPEDKAPVSSPHVDTSKPDSEIPTATSIGLTINSLVNTNGMVKYQASVSGATNGKCSAIFTNQVGKPVTHVSDTTNGTCTASILEQEFDAYGEWHLRLTFYANNTKAEAHSTIRLERP